MDFLLLSVTVGTPSTALLSSSTVSLDMYANLPCSIFEYHSGFTAPDEVTASIVSKSPWKKNSVGTGCVLRSAKL